MYEYTLPPHADSTDTGVQLHVTSWCCCAQWCCRQHTGLTNTALRSSTESVVANLDAWNVVSTQQSSAVAAALQSVKLHRMRARTCSASHQALSIYCTCLLVLMIADEAVNDP
jgi:hypothetical protein